MASFNPWVSLYWLTTGHTVGGLELYPANNRLDRTKALELWTKGSAWFSGEDEKKGAIRVGEYADLAVLSADYFSIPAEEIKGLYAVLTMVGGAFVHGDGAFKDLAPPLPPVSPDWSPVRAYGGYQHAATRRHGTQSSWASTAYGHDLVHASYASTRHQPANRFWGMLGCSCFAF